MESIKSASPYIFRAIGSYYTTLIFAIITGIIFSIVLFNSLTDRDGCENDTGRVKILVGYMFILTVYLILLSISIYNYYKPVDIAVTAESS